ncbi:hypothetical protein L6164_019354 [Bauhinia variegata]|uniref:Uncharacterized protein n=1 Tax=Bauhinia variegata TaxID=167791 RepID=A0ACB9MTG0_BAUVA|nr:hypothetical protein L6164_019354 [Bauhinia variegata]
MAAKPLTTEAIAQTEKKMDMALDDIIKMSKNTKARKQRGVPNKSQKFSNGFNQDKSSKVQRYTESRSSLRQGVLAKRRSNFQGNQFPVATEVAQKAAVAVAVAPLRNRASNRNRIANWNRPRFGVPPSQRRGAGGGFAAKPLPSPRQQQEEEVNTMPKQKPQTLDSLFANMKEQRLRVLSRQTNVVQRNGGGNRRPPWGRARFGN